MKSLSKCLAGHGSWAESAILKRMTYNTFVQCIIIQKEWMFNH